MRATGEPDATRSLIGRSELVDWCLVIRRVRFACAMDNSCHVSTMRETSQRCVRVRSCPANIGASLALSVTDPVTLGNGIRYIVLGTFLKTGPPCRVCPCSPPPDQLSQWARGGRPIICKYSYVILKIRPLSYFHEGHRMCRQRNSNTPFQKPGYFGGNCARTVVHRVVFTTFFFR